MVNKRNTKRRPLTEAQLRAIQRELRHDAGGHCENCGVKHGLLIDMPDGTFFRYEIALHRLNGRPRDNRRVNLRVWCQVCRGAPVPSCLFRTQPPAVGGRIRHHLK